MSSQTHSVNPSPQTEGADWFARLRAGELTELEAMRFRAWLARDPAHRREFDQVDTLWDELSAMERLPSVAAERAAIAAARKTMPGRGKAGVWIGSIAAGLLVALAALFWAGERDSQTYATAVGEQRVLPLSDGSIVTLNTASKVRILYSAKQRGIELITGQANFEVARDSQRPFVVSAGSGEVTALGTVFDIYKAADKVTVTLLEGRIAVKALPDGAAQLDLAAGEQVSYPMAKGKVERKAVRVDRVSAWRVRKLDFSDTPLLEAIAESNRYSDTHIELDAPELAAAEINGTFDAGKPELFAEGLSGYFHLTVTRPADDLIVLSSQPSRNMPEPH